MSSSDSIDALKKQYPNATVFALKTLQRCMIEQPSLVTLMQSFCANFPEQSSDSILINMQTSACISPINKLLNCKVQVPADFSKRIASCKLSLATIVSLIIQHTELINLEDYSTIFEHFRELELKAIDCFDEELIQKYSDIDVNMLKLLAQVKQAGIPLKREIQSSPHFWRTVLGINGILSVDCDVWEYQPTPEEDYDNLNRLMLWFTCPIENRVITDKWINEGLAAALGKIRSVLMRESIPQAPVKDTPRLIRFSFANGKDYYYSNLELNQHLEHVLDLIASNVTADDSVSIEKSDSVFCINCNRRRVGTSATQALLQKREIITSNYTAFDKQLTMFDVKRRTAFLNRLFTFSKKEFIYDTVTGYILCILNEVMDITPIINAKRANVMDWFLIVMSISNGNKDWSEILSFDGADYLVQRLSDFIAPEISLAGAFVGLAMRALNRPVTIEILAGVHNQYVHVNYHGDSFELDSALVFVDIQKFIEITKMYRFKSAVVSVSDGQLQVII